MRSQRDGDQHLILIIWRRRCRPRHRAAGLRACGGASGSGDAAAIGGVPRYQGGRRLRALHAPPDPLVIPNIPYFSCSVLGFATIYCGYSRFHCEIIAVVLIELVAAVQTTSSLHIWSHGASNWVEPTLMAARATFVPVDITRVRISLIFLSNSISLNWRWISSHANIYAMGQFYYVRNGNLVRAWIRWL